MGCEEIFFMVKGNFYWNVVKFVGQECCYWFFQYILFIIKIVIDKWFDDLYV